MSDWERVLKFFQLPSIYIITTGLIFLQNYIEQDDKQKTLPDPSYQVEILLTVQTLQKRSNRTISQKPQTILSKYLKFSPYSKGFRLWSYFFHCNGTQGWGPTFLFRIFWFINIHRTNICLIANSLKLPELLKATRNRSKILCPHPPP